MGTREGRAGHCQCICIYKINISIVHAFYGAVPRNPDIAVYLRGFEGICSDLEGKHHVG